ncbi:MAG: hypothetical protein KC731_02720 [Myxococcales bacterium]|nr:hypothetical protein [Myxococcales bacterium]
MGWPLMGWQHGLAPLIVTAAACGPILGIGDLVFDRDGAGGVGGTSSDGGASTNGGAGPGGGDLGGGGAGGGAGGGTTAVPVTVAGDNPMVIEVAGRFRLELTDRTRFHIDKWFDLAVDASRDLAGTPDFLGYTEALYAPWALRVGPTWFVLDDAVLDNVTVVATGPARVGVLSQLEWAPPGSGLISTTLHYVYASGRIGMQGFLQNQSGGDVTLGTEKHHVTVSGDGTWGVVTPTADSLIFSRSDSPSAVLVQQEAGGTLGQDSTVNRFWSLGDVAIPDGGSLRAAAEMVLAPPGASDTDLVVWQGDLENKSATATGAAIEYDRSQAAFRVTCDVGASAVTVTLDTQRPRRSPAIVFDGWMNADWQIRRGNEVLVASDALVGTDAVAQYDATLEQVVLVYLPVVATGDPEPSFTLEAK